MVGGEGIEPSRLLGHRILSPACLPIPPLARKSQITYHACLPARQGSWITYHQKNNNQLVCFAEVPIDRDESGPLAQKQFYKKAADGISRCISSSGQATPRPSPWQGDVLAPAKGSDYIASSRRHSTPEPASLWLELFLLLNLFL
jgi:hypothetical protein